MSQVYRTPAEALRGLADREPTRANELRDMAEKLEKFYELYHSGAWTEDAYFKSLSCIIYAYELWHSITDDPAFMDAVEYHKKQEGWTL